MVRSLYAHMAKIYPKGGLPPLITVADLDLPGIDPAVAENAVKQASGVVRDYCRWRIDRETVINYQPEGDLSRILLLPTAYIVDVLKVVVDEVEWQPFSFANDWDYSVMTNAAGLRARGRRRWPLQEGRISIDFVHGFLLCDPLDSPGDDLCGIPEGLKAVIVRIARRGLANPQGYQSQSLKVGEITEGFVQGGGGGIYPVHNRFGVQQIDTEVLNLYRVDVE